MGKFKNKKREMGAISTASLPDIVFMLLFFFMVATVLRTEEEMVRVIRPEASEIYKICLLYTSPSPRDRQKSRMPSSA